MKVAARVSLVVGPDRTVELSSEPIPVDAEPGEQVEVVILAGEDTNDPAWTGMLLADSMLSRIWDDPDEDAAWNHM